VRGMPHQVWIRHGDLPRRVEDCPRFGCRVGPDNVTDCDHMACRHCGIGPLTVIRPTPGTHDPVATYCEACVRTYLL